MGAEEAAGATAASASRCVSARGAAAGPRSGSLRVRGTTMGTAGTGRSDGGQRLPLRVHLRSGGGLPVRQWR